jgi:nucleotide-binding universal stress UspA family protein
MSDRTLIGTHIMVPLDGSELAERALPVATRVASALSATLVLARITLPLTTPPAAWDEMISSHLYQEMIDKAAHDADAYLEGMARPLRAQGLPVQTITEQGVAAPTLIDLLARLQIGLIVMTTHARSGMARFALGSVADALTRESHVPVLLLRPLIEEQERESLDHALIPLDGSELAEAALGPAVALAGVLVRSMTLLRVVPKRDGHAALEEMETAERYMAEARTRLKEQVADQAMVETQVVRGDPSAEIIRRAASHCDLVIMATHGATGARRRTFGSVADRVLHDTGTPLLLICPSQSGQQAVIAPG